MCQNRQTFTYFTAADLISAQQRNQLAKAKVIQDIDSSDISLLREHECGAGQFFLALNVARSALSVRPLNACSLLDTLATRAAECILGYLRHP